MACRGDVLTQLSMKEFYVGYAHFCYDCGGDGIYRIFDHEPTEDELDELERELSTTSVCITSGSSELQIDWEKLGRPFLQNILSSMYLDFVLDKMKGPKADSSNPIVGLMKGEE